MRSIGHFIGGKEVKGTSGRTADVYEPMTGEIQAKVALASKAEVRAAVENARAAQVEWGATNPQRRVRVLMKFLELVARDNEALANFGASTRQTIPDARGDILRGVGSSNLRRHSAIDEGRIHRRRRSASISIQCASRSASWPVSRRSISRDDPHVEIRASIACGNAFILSRRARSACR